MYCMYLIKGKKTQKSLLPKHEIFKKLVTYIYTNVLNKMAFVGVGRQQVGATIAHFKEQQQKMKKIFIACYKLYLNSRDFGRSFLLINSREKTKTLNYLESAQKIDVCVCV